MSLLCNLHSVEIETQGERTSLPFYLPVWKALVRETPRFTSPLLRCTYMEGQNREPSNKCSPKLRDRETTAWLVWSGWTNSLLDLWLVSPNSQLSTSLDQSRIWWLIPPKKSSSSSLSRASCFLSPSDLCGCRQSCSFVPSFRLIVPTQRSPTPCYMLLLNYLKSYKDTLTEPGYKMSKCVWFKFIKRC